jgi:hypothetical protein
MASDFTKHIGAMLNNRGEPFDGFDYFYPPIKTSNLVEFEFSLQR